MIKYILLSFLVSTFITIFAIKFKPLRVLFNDRCDSGPQKFHKTPVPRMGGIGIFIGFVAAGILYTVFKGGTFFILFIISCLPIFLAGFIEDALKNVKPRYRLLAGMFSAILGILLYGSLLNRLDFPFVGNLFLPVFAAYILTIIGVAGVTNSINIIDGFNGLASMTAVLIFIGLAYVSFKVNYYPLIFICFTMIAAIMGFFLFNYPFGLIFLGDAGAYFIGFVIAEVSILLVMRHTQVSVWFPMLLVIYPVTETLFSVYRRKVIGGKSPFAPDGVHFHTLIYKRIMQFLVNKSNSNFLLFQNSGTSVFIWAIEGVIMFLGVMFWDNSIVLILFIIAFIVFYITSYKRLVRFRVNMKKKQKSIYI